MLAWSTSHGIAWHGMWSGQRTPIIIGVACSVKRFYPAITLIDHDKCEEEIGLNLFQAQVHYIPLTAKYFF